VPRPDYITRLHEADYDLRACDRELKERMRARYEQALAEACRLTGVTAERLEQVLAPDFRVWMRQQGLPRPGHRP
jgi:metal-dependent amidase/aminoacylase/carboxypeptidase family protein